MNGYYFNILEEITINRFDLAGRSAIVTGGSRGLGRAMVEALHESGAEVVIIDMSDDVEAIAASISQNGPAVYGVKANLLEREDIVRSFDEALAHLSGKVDILINNAGMHVRKPCIGFPISAWENVLELNLTVPFLLSQLAGETMIKHGYGKIINITSVVGVVGGFNATAYSSSKGAINQLTKSLSNEWAEKGINVNAIAPGYMDTLINADLKSDGTRLANINARIPAGRWGTSEDLKGAVIFLSSQSSDYIHGIILPVDGGFLGR